MYQKSPNAKVFVKYFAFIFDMRNLMPEKVSAPKVAACASHKYNRNNYYISSQGINPKTHPLANSNTKNNYIIQSVNITYGITPSSCQISESVSHDIFRFFIYDEEKVKQKIGPVNNLC